MTDGGIPEREVRRSYVLGVLNGAAFGFVEALIDPPLVLTWFVSQLTTSNLLIGLVAPLGDAGWALPQIFVSSRVQRLRRKMPSYTATAVVRTAAWLLLATAVWLLDDPLLLLLGFLGIYAVARLVSGLGGLAFFEVVAKTIPPGRRGSFFAWRQTLGGLLGLGGGWIVKTVLNHPRFPFPHGHALLFFMYAVGMAIGMLAFALVREPPGMAVAESVSSGEQLRRAGRLLRTNRVYRRYTAARVVLALAGIALPFYGVYAKNVLGAPPGMVGIYVTVRIGAMMVCNLLWGRLSDRRGNQLVMRLAGLCGGITALSAVTLVALVGLLHPQGSWLPYLALPLFLLDGAVRPAQVLVGSNFLLELAPEDQRSLYLGFSNTLQGVVVLISGLGGLVVDTFGFVGLFALSIGLSLLGYAFATGLPEPRQAGA